MAPHADPARFALCVALGISYILKPLLEFLGGAAPPSPLVQNAVAVLLVALPFAYLTGNLLLHLEMRMAPAAAQARRFACLTCAMVCALLLLLAVPLTALWLLTGGGGSPAAAPRGALCL